MTFKSFNKSSLERIHGINDEELKQSINKIYKFDLAPKFSQKRCFKLLEVAINGEILLKRLC